jgi:formylglycine-generating enzyme required for sulfatase activity/tRNA A-37 threonylcarbamoyl transferase component Bud32
MVACRCGLLARVELLARWNALSFEDSLMSPSSEPPATNDPVTCPRCRFAFQPASSETSPAMPALPADGDGDVTQTRLPGSNSPAVAVLAQAEGDVPGKIGRFTIRRFLGEGVFGRVYEAYDLSLRRVVALKVAKAEQLATAGRVRRFQREARAAAGLAHPNIVGVFDAGQDGAHHYIAMSFIAGRSLEAVLETQGSGRALPVKQAVQIVRKLAEALAYAHRNHVIHRDVKPANVLIDEQGEPLLADFGLAARADEEDRETRGKALGTPAFTAPEQWRGEAEAASDQYSLGCLLYELLTGQTPFSGSNDGHYMFLHLNDPPPSPRTVNAAVPRDLETICLKCLEKEPGKRYPDCQALADDLRRWQEGEPVTARRPGMAERLLRWSRRNPALASLLGVTLLALVTVTVLSANLAVARNNALREADKAKKARDFLVNIFEKAKTDEKGGNVTVRQLLDEAETRIPDEFEDQAELRDELLKAIGDVKRGIAQRTPQAMILEVRGTVQLQSADGKKKEAVAQALLNLDDRLSLSSDAQVQVVFLSDFHKERLAPGREVTIDYKGCQPADAIFEHDSSVLMTFVRLPKGTFYMGWYGTKGSAKKTPILEDFEIAVHDVTQGQWEAVMGRGNNPSWFSRKGNGRHLVVDISDEELKLFPVENVSWDDAQAFIKKLNEKERRHGYVYRLPTDAEWEYACRNGATSLEECSFHFYLDKPTNDLSSSQANFDGNYPEGKGEKGPLLHRPTRVGAYHPNKLGLCDMHGNVWQWCADLDNPKGSHRVIRGGSWFEFGQFCQAWFRRTIAPSDRGINLGFRLARVPRPVPGK